MTPKRVGSNAAKALGELVGAALTVSSWLTVVGAARLLVPAAPAPRLRGPAGRPRVVLVRPASNAAPAGPTRPGKAPAGATPGRAGGVNETGPAGRWAAQRGHTMALPPPKLAVLGGPSAQSEGPGREVRRGVETTA